MHLSSFICNSFTQSKAYRDILTRNSFLNAIAVINVLGGSTNAVNIILIMHFYLMLYFDQYLRYCTSWQWQEQLTLF